MVKGVLLLWFILQVQFSISKHTTLAELLALKLHKFEDDIRSIVDKAVKELGTEKVCIFPLLEIFNSCMDMNYYNDFSYLTFMKSAITVKKMAALDKQYIYVYLEQVHPVKMSEQNWNPGSAVLL